MIISFFCAFYILALIYWGSRTKPGFASWHMFADLHKVLLDLEYQAADGTWKKLNPWEYLPHTHLNMSRDELKFFLHYLQQVHNLQVRGTATEYSGDKKFILRIGR